MRLVHSEMRLVASEVAARLGLVDTTAVGCCSEPSCDAILGTVVVVISSGYSLVTGRLVYPVLVRMCAARTRPSPPLIRFSITASFLVDLGPSLWTNTTSPVLLLIGPSCSVEFTKRCEVLVPPSVPEMFEDTGLRCYLLPHVRCTSIVRIGWIIVSNGVRQ